MGDGELDFQDVKTRVIAAVDRLYRNDRYLLEEGVNERSVTHHLANYIKEQFPKWDVDVEYNRNVGRVKEIKNLSLEPTSACDLDARSVYPNVIVHCRGSDVNLLVVEVKRPGRAGGDWDHEKLRGFTRPIDSEGLGYMWGVHLVLYPDGKFEMQWFRGGHEVPSPDAESSQSVRQG